MHFFRLEWCLNYFSYDFYLATNLHFKTVALEIKINVRKESKIGMQLNLCKMSTMALHEEIRKIRLN